MFGLAFALSYLTYKDIESFFIFLTIFSGFVFWSGLIDLWILIINIIVITIILINNVNKRRYE